MTPSDLGHEFTRFGPFLLVLLWAGMVALFRRRPPRPLEPPAPRPVVQRPPPAVAPAISLAYEAVRRPPPPPARAPSPPRTAPSAAPAPVISEAETARALAAARVEATALAAQAEADLELRRERLAGSAWARSVVVAEILAPPLALRRPGTLGAPGAF